MKRPRTGGDDEIARELQAWFPAAARDLPWRTHPRNPYHALVAEVMLQQTQVSRVIERFSAFIARFPRVSDLAAADEGQVLAMWSGLGYYRRARHLHAAARAIIAEHGGVVPSDPAALRALPGVGRYTAGAIASIAFGRAEPIVDGNVRRVLMRLEGRVFAATDRPGEGDREADRWAWARADELVGAATQPGVFNEALMELGATVCLPAPAAPRCDDCPWRARCIAKRDGTAGSIPPPKAAARQRTICCICLLARDARGRFAIEQRPATGMWAGLWQLPTIERDGRWPTAAALRDWAAMRGLSLARGAGGAGGAGGGRGGAEPLGEFTHQTTHRLVKFRVLAAVPVACRRKAATRRWVESFDGLGVSSAQERALALAAGAAAGIAVGTAAMRARVR
jgi:A/G-specific adenine glycosylase